MAHKGIHSRGYLPHWDFADSVQAVTFRLADSLPRDVVNDWKRDLRELLKSPDPTISAKAQADLHSRIADFEDAGHGACLLENPQHATVVQDIFIEGHGVCYKLIDWCIMPNHVHVLIRLLDDTSLGEVIKNWKAPAAILINRLEGRTGSLWMADYHDRLIRDWDHLENARAYIRNNPVKAGLCQDAKEWAFSGAGANWSAEFIPREPVGMDPCEGKPTAAIFENAATDLSGNDSLEQGVRDETGSAEFIPREPVSEVVVRRGLPCEVRGRREMGGLYGGSLSPDETNRPDETGSRGINSALPVSGSALSGHLDLRCELRAGGVPYISRQSFRAPIHLSKSHLDEGHLVQSIVNPTAGFFDGDVLAMKVEVGRGAKLVLSTPSASRVYRTRSGGAAVCSQDFRVEENASLEWIPEPFIPHAGARYVQRTRIDLEASASLLYFDWIAPGRVAMGEVFAYRQLRWELDLFLGGKLIARERYDLMPGNVSLEALRAKFPAAHYVSVYVAGEMAKNWPVAELEAFTGEDVYLGHGPLTGGVQVIRALCRDSLSARKLLETLRPLLYRSAEKTPPALGRIFC